MKKIVIFGGGSGLSQILKGLKLFPIDISAVVSVADNGASTGKLRKEMNIPAVGDISKVLLALSDADNDIIDLMNYRFEKSTSLNNHSIKNLLLSALLDQKGSFAKALPVLAKIIGVKGSVLPITEDNINLVGITSEHQKIVGEEELTKSDAKIYKVECDKRFKINPDVFKAINAADLIIFSSGSILTSIAPHLIDRKLVDKINTAKAKKLYICNLFTQPGETDDYKVSDHIKEIEKYLGHDTLDVVIANNDIMDSELAKKYAYKEEKDPVILDKENLVNRKIKVIEDKLYKIEDGVYRHDELKTAYLIFSYLMDN